SPILSALETTNLVCGSGPSAASTRTRAPSTMLRMRSTSPPKSAWPGVSTILMRVSFQTSEVALARIVMPRSRSRSLESSTRSTTRWFSRNEPDCCSSRSTSVVLPWSTWAMMAILRSFMECRTLNRYGPRRARYCDAYIVRFGAEAIVRELLLEHDLSRKPVTVLRIHALKPQHTGFRRRIGRRFERGRPKRALGDVLQRDRERSGRAVYRHLTEELQAEAR